MIICICNNISETKIRHAVDAGMSSMAELRDQMDLGKCCGKCHAAAKGVLRECLHGQNPRCKENKAVYQPIKVLPFSPVAIPA